MNVDLKNNYYLQCSICIEKKGYFINCASLAIGNQYATL